MPVSRLKSSSKVSKQSKRHDTSTPIKKSKSATSSFERTKRELDMVRCRFTARQTRMWHPLDKELRQLLDGMLENAVKTVGSKPVFAGDDDVQTLLSQLKQQLKSKLHTVLVPKQRGRPTTNLRTKMMQLEEESERLKLQTSELEREIRQEERRIEQLEDGRLLQSPTGQEIDLQIPENELDLPSIVFNNT